MWFTIGCEQRQLLSVRVYPLGRARVHFARFVWSSKCGEFLMCQSSSLCNKSKVWYLNGRITCSPFFPNRVNILLIMFVHLFSGISGAFDNFALFFFGMNAFCVTPLREPCSVSYILAHDVCPVRTKQR